MINLLQEQNLNSINYSEPEIMMVHFLQATKYDVNMYAKIQ
jgi:hypothetical protein